MRDDEANPDNCYVRGKCPRQRRLIPSVAINHAVGRRTQLEIALILCVNSFRDG